MEKANSNNFCSNLSMACPSKCSSTPSLCGSSSYCVVTPLCQTDVNRAIRKFMIEIIKFCYEKFILSYTYNEDDSISNNVNLDASKDKSKTNNSNNANKGKNGCNAKDKMKSKISEKKRNENFVNGIKRAFDSRLGGEWNVLYGIQFGYALKYKKGCVAVFSIHSFINENGKEQKTKYSRNEEMEWQGAEAEKGNKSSKVNRWILVAYKSPLIEIIDPNKVNIMCNKQIEFFEYYSCPNHCIHYNNDHESENEVMRQSEKDKVMKDYVGRENTINTIENRTDNKLMKTILKKYYTKDLMTHYIDPPPEQQCAESALSVHIIKNEIIKEFIIANNVDYQYIATLIRFNLTYLTNPTWHVIVGKHFAVAYSNFRTFSISPSSSFPDSSYISSSPSSVSSFSPLKYSREILTFLKSQKHEKYVMRGMPNGYRFRC